jgi:hypothetical protein
VEVIFIGGGEGTGRPVPLPGFIEHGAGLGPGLAGTTEQQQAGCGKGHQSGNHSVVHLISSNGDFISRCLSGGVQSAFHQLLSGASLEKRGSRSTAGTNRRI